MGVSHVESSMPSPRGRLIEQENGQVVLSS
jgi:hypothetical protein